LIIQHGLSHKNLLYPFYQRGFYSVYLSTLVGIKPVMESGV